VERVLVAHAVIPSDQGERVAKGKNILACLSDEGMSRSNEPLQGSIRVGTFEFRRSGARAAPLSRFRGAV